MLCGLSMLCIHMCKYASFFLRSLYLIFIFYVTLRVVRACVRDRDLDLKPNRIGSVLLLSCIVVDASRSLFISSEVGDVGKWG